MNKDEKLLREYVRESLGHPPMLQEAVTAGELKYALQLIKKHKNVEKAKAIAKTAGKAGVVGLLSALSGGTLAPALVATAAKYGAIEAGQAAYDAYKAVGELEPAEKMKNKVLDFLSVDPDVLDIVDDKVEDEFEKDFLSRLRYYEDADELPDADKAFTAWLKNKFNKAHVTKEG